MSDTDLLPCPFCGGEADMMQNDFDISCNRGTVMCMTCFATSADNDGSWQEATCLWNTRTPPTPAQIIALVPELDFQQTDFARWTTGMIFGGEYKIRYDGEDFIVTRGHAILVSRNSTQADAEVSAQLDYTARILRALGLGGDYE